MTHIVFQEANRVLSNTLHRMPVKTGDVFIMWSMKMRNEE